MQIIKLSFFIIKINKNNFKFKSAYDKLYFYLFFNKFLTNQALLNNIFNTKH